MMTHTTDLNIFKKMDSDSLLRNYRAYTEALANPRVPTATPPCSSDSASASKK